MVATTEGEDPTELYFVMYIERVTLELAWFQEAEDAGWTKESHR